jgi:hypothetical protein
MHLGHGVSAMFQSLGWRNSVWWPRIARFAQVVSVVLFLGYASIPMAIFMRTVGYEYGERAKRQFSEIAMPAGKTLAAETK